MALESTAIWPKMSATRVGEAFLGELTLDDLALVPAQQRLGGVSELLDLIGDRVRCSASSGCAAQPIRAHLSLDPPAEVVDQHPIEPIGSDRPISPRPESCSPSGFSPESAMKARSTSLAPSKIGKIRMSRSTFS